MAVGGGGVYLPPVVQELAGEIGPLVAKLREAQAALAKFAAQDHAAIIDADTSRLYGQLEAAEMAIAAVTSNPAVINLRVEGAATAIAQIAAVRAVAGKAGAKGPGLLSLLGLGGGILGMAGIGSALSLAGFGFEHLLMTSLGLAGSAAGGLLGGGALGLGALGTIGVGMGSDMAVASSTLADTKALTKLYGNLADAVAVYGKNSSQAVAAQQALNAQIIALGGAGQVGVAAEMRLAQAAVNFNAIWDRVTQQARATFVDRIAMPLLQVAQNYLPLVANAANRNFGIIGQALIPLWYFLAVQGKEIFTNLEIVFARDLPIGMGIFEQSLELILKTMDHIATSNNFGGFLSKILAFVTNLNGAGFNHFMSQIDSMIKLFHIWATFIGVLGRDIFDLFSQTVGLGSSIIVTLTGMLQKLGEWERSTQGKAALNNLFQAHKQEVLELLALLAQLVKTVGPIYLQLATTFTRLAVPIIGLILNVVDFLTHLGGGVGQVMSFALGLALIETRLRAISTSILLVQGTIAIFTAMQGAALALASGMTAEEFAANAAAAGITQTGLATAVLQAKQVLLSVWTGIVTAAQWAWNVAMDANPIGLVILGIAALIVGIVLLVTHFQQVQQWLINVQKSFGLLESFVLAILGPFGAVIGLMIQLVIHFQDVVIWASKLPVIGGLFKGLADTVSGSSKSMSANVSASTAQMTKNVSANMAQMSASGIGSMHALSMSTVDYANQMNLRTQADTTQMRDQLIASFNQQFGQGSAKAQQLSAAVTAAYGQMKNQGISDAGVMRMQMIDQINQLYGQGTAQARALILAIDVQFGSLAGTGYQAGYGLGTGLINGMSASKAAAIAMAYALGADASAAVRQGAKVASPSQITTSAGRELANGLIVGMNQRLAAAVTMGVHLGQSVANAIVPRAASGALGLAGAGAGGGNLVMHVSAPISVQVPAGANAGQVGTAVEQAVDKAMGKVVKALRGGAVAYPGQ